MAPFKPFVFIFFFFFFFFFLIHQSSSATTTTSTSSHGDIVPETCKLCAEGDPNINYTFCVGSLGSVPKSHRSDRRGLAIIAAKLAKTEAKHAKSKVTELMKATQQMSPYLKSCFETCREMYSTCMSDLKDAMRAIKTGRNDDANVYLSAALDAPTTCEDGFTEGNISSPLAAEDGVLFSRVAIALAIAALLK